MDFFAEVLPATAATPTGTWKLGYSLNGAAATYPMTVDSGGALVALSTITSGGNIITGATGRVQTGTDVTNSYFLLGGRGKILGPADGVFNLANNAVAIGSQLKVDALPTVSSGFGTTPGITAGSTPLAGSINVGTGGVATSGVINFNGTAFPSAPFVVCMNTTTGAVVRATASTTQLTITAPAAFVASDVIAWVAISSK